MLSDNADVSRAERAYPHPSSLRSTYMYASFLRICPRFAWTPTLWGGFPVSEALHMGIFSQHPITVLSDSLQGWPYG